MFLFQTPDDIYFVHFLLQIACQKIQISFCNRKTAMPEYLLKGHDRASHNRPFFRKRVSETMNTCLFHASFVTVVPQCVIITASGELLTIYRAKEPIVSLSPLYTVNTLSVSSKYLRSRYMSESGFYWLLEAEFQNGADTYAS